MIGRCVSVLSAATAARSSVLRVYVSNVRMPRSHIMTSRLPPLSTYSAAESVSSIVAESPRLSSTGLPHLAELLEHHEVLHVARADLQHVGPLGDRLGVAHVEHLGDDRQSDRVARGAQELQPLEPHALERVRARCAA